MPDPNPSDPHKDPAGRHAQRPPAAEPASSRAACLTNRRENHSSSLLTRVGASVNVRKNFGNNKPRKDNERKVRATISRLPLVRYRDVVIEVKIIE